MIISLFETVRLSVSISPRNLYNSLKSIKEMLIHTVINEKCMTKTELTFQTKVFALNLLLIFSDFYITKPIAHIKLFILSKGAFS